MACSTTPPTAPRWRARLAEGPITLYYGCDPTAASLHHGNLLGLVMLRRFQEAGHRPLALAGGATGMIGDPGGRSDERNLLDPRRPCGPTWPPSRPRSPGSWARRGPWQLVDNLTWTAELRVLDFLRDVGKHVTVNQMVARDSVKSRMAGEHGISYTEFSYMLLQANDFAWLHEHEGCELQIGGSDQWGNILSGRRPHPPPVRCGGARPVLAAPAGRATARSWARPPAPGCGSTPSAPRPYAFFQHWINTDDADVARMLAQFTLLPMDEVDADRRRPRRGAPGRRAGQRAWRRP